MNTSAEMFFQAVGFFVLVVLCVGCLGEVALAFLMVQQLRPLKTREQWELEAELSWKCFVANYAWRLRFPLAVKASLKAAAELEVWTQGEAAQVIVRWSPRAPSQKRYRLYNRFDLSS